MADFTPDVPVADGNWYVLTVGLPRIDKALTIASGVSIVSLDVPLDVFDLAAVGGVGFRE